jgi:hypothetical protein
MTSLPRLTALALLALALPALATPHPARWSLDDLRRLHVLPAAPPRATLVPPLATEHQVGTARAFWTYDLSVMPPKNKQVASTCRAVGDTVAVYVADSQWPAKVDQADVDAIVQAFDVDTPKADGVGITARNTDLFGQPSDIDGDGRLIVFIYDIAGYQGNTFDGFFRAEDLAANNPACANNPMLYCSNEAEMVHVNSTDPGSAYMLGVMAHEFQHLIHFVADPDEESWINEALSELAMSVSGYEDTGNLHAYLNDPSAPLETAEFVDYGAVMLWGTWLYERFGADFVRALVVEPANGRAGLAATWAALGQQVTFEATFADWALANVLDAEGALGYALLELPHFPPDGAIPGLFNGSASTSLTVLPSSYAWLEDTVGDLGTDDLKISIPADSGALLRVAGTDPTLVQPVDETTVVAPSFLLGKAIQVVVANPTKATKSVTVTFQAVAPQVGPEPAEEPQPEVIEPAPDAVTADTSAPDTAAEAAAPDATASDDVTPQVEDQPEAEEGGGGSCALAPVATPGALPLLLAALALVARRRQTA